MTIMARWILSFLRRTSRLLRWGATTLALLLLLLILASWLMEEPLRARIEQTMNQHLHGYSVSLPALDFHLFGFSLTLHDLIIRQDAHPEPPVAHFPRLHASVHWRELLVARLVAEFEFNNPRLYINRIQLRQELEDPVPVDEKGWQEAFESIYPLRINHLAITGGELTYIDQDPDRPLRLSEVGMDVDNIRNIRYPERIYPSPFRLEGILFQSGVLIIDGQANFLAEPHPGINGRIDLKQVPLDDLQPLADRTNLYVRGGTVDAAGQVEYAPEVKTAVLETLHIQGMHLDYIQSPLTAEIEERQRQQFRQAAETVEREGLRLRAGTVRVTDTVLGYVNETEEPHYRIFLEETELTMSNFSDGFRHGPARVFLTGLFMGSGPTEATGEFRPIAEGSDFDLKIRIEDAHLPAMNDLLRAYAGLDVAAGRFSFFSELEIRGSSISGYVRPFFIDLEIPAPEEEDEDKGALQRVYEWVAGAILSLLAGPEGELATQADITGTIDDPEASTFQIIVNLILNAFFNIILPGFEGEVEGLRERVEAVTEREEP
jgi:hypothetical protein